MSATSCARIPELPLLEAGEPLESLLPRMASANAYLGADVVARGARHRRRGRDDRPRRRSVAVPRRRDAPLRLVATTTGRGSRPARWPAICSNARRRSPAAASPIPARRTSSDLADLGYPFADVSADGSVSHRQAAGSGGRVDVATCTEQLLYEIHDPARYITPDCVLDITDVRFERGRPPTAFASTGRERRRARDLQGRGRLFRRLDRLGRGGLCRHQCRRRAQARAPRSCRSGFAGRAASPDEIRVDLIGMSSLHGDDGSIAAASPTRCACASPRAPRPQGGRRGRRSRCAACTCKGPAGGGGGSTSVRAR